MREIERAVVCAVGLRIDVDLHRRRRGPIAGDGVLVDEPLRVRLTGVVGGPGGREEVGDVAEGVEAQALPCALAGRGGGRVVCGVVGGGGGGGVAKDVGEVEAGGRRGVGEEDERGTGVDADGVGCPVCGEELDLGLRGNSGGGRRVLVAAVPVCLAGYGRTERIVLYLLQNVAQRQRCDAGHRARRVEQHDV